MLVACHFGSGAWIAFAIILSVVVGFLMVDRSRRRPSAARRGRYQVGDRIEIDERTRGRVIHVGRRWTRLRSPEGAEYWVPDRMMNKATVCEQGPADGRTTKQYWT
ncbi:hypothetical protein ENSA5_57990 [Enhygromyxa salina]|uniref:Mechanosensitive ion channel MscS domain-containing protein n=1 Tax=Enhygromyxa salina TaxID=215803 RepID=A0A2S9XE50_9BACT|nr:mechanosensitive ion channel family protein [Enhygromyxa salina]PRP91139.1 hypothetical protein ENSA5_57990 [Enhygromyxa salina]